MSHPPTLDELHATLERHGGEPSLFPTISDELILAVMEKSDECQECGKRWITRGNGHTEGCGLSRFYL